MVETLPVSIRATDSRFLSLVRAHLGAHLVPHPPDGDSVYRLSADCGNERVLPGGKLAQRVGTLYLGAARIYRARALDELAGAVIAVVRDYVTSIQDQFIRIRAGAVALGQGAMILPTQPSPHLASLVGLLVRNGAGYIADEVVLLDPVLRLAHGTPQLPLLMDVSELPFFPELKREMPARRRRRADGAMSPVCPVSLSEIGGRAVGPRAVNTIVFPKFETGAETRLEVLGKSDALFRLARTALNLHVWTDRGLTVMRDLLDLASVGQLVAGSVPAAAEVLSSALANGL